jgi:hypothetical protein
LVQLNVERYKGNDAQTEILVTEYNRNFSVAMSKVVLNITYRVQNLCR